METSKIRFKKRTLDNWNYENMNFESWINNNNKDKILKVELIIKIIRFWNNNNNNNNNKILKVELIIIIDFEIIIRYWNNNNNNNILKVELIIIIIRIRF